jgi:hypothetical protein
MDRPSFTDNSDRATAANRSAAMACEPKVQARARRDLSRPSQMRRVFLLV